MAKLGRNERCPCGSGKKYKLCCEPGDQRVPHLKSTTVRSFLSGKPAAIALWDQIQEYYGSQLIIREQQPGLENSSYEIRTSLHPNPRFDCSFVNLNTRSRRVAAALTHELLHLQLPILGFPCFVGLVTDQTWNVNLPGETTMKLAEEQISKMFNVLHHEIFLTDFLSFGFPSTEFVANRNEDDIGASTNKGKAMLGKTELAACVRGLWNAYYFTELVSDHLGPATDRSDTVRTQGREFLPTMDADAERMRDWFEAGRFRTVEKYASEVNELIDGMTLPRVIFGRLERISEGIRLVV